MQFLRTALVCAILCKLSLCDDLDCNQDGTTYIYDGDCSKYWECSNGNGYLYSCPSGLWWHQEVGQCDYPGDYCIDTATTSSTDTPFPTEGTSGTTSPYDTTSQPTKETTTESPGGNPTCPPDGENTFFPYPDDCSKYWSCYDGVAYLENCPEGLEWHNSISECDYPGDFCGQITDGTVTVSVPTEDPLCALQDDGATVPYDGDCTKFYQCSGGVKYEKSCPDGLWYNPDTAQCDFPGDFCTETTTIS